MTYYELIDYLYGIVKKPIDYRNIEFLNSVNINLEDERYNRFLDQLAIILTDRLTILINNLKDKIVLEYMDANTLSLEIVNVKKDFQYCKDIAKCKLVKYENQAEYIDTLDNTKKLLADSLLHFYDDEERINIIKTLYTKEDNNELQ